MAVYTRDTDTLWILNDNLVDWSEFAGGGGGGDLLELEAGENLLAGTPVYVSANLVYAANNSTHPNIVGIVRTDVTTGLLAKLVTSGKLKLTGLTSGVPYFVGIGTITATPPNSGYLIRVGTAVKSDTLIVNIEEPILLV